MRARLSAPGAVALRNSVFQVPNSCSRHTYKTKIRIGAQDIRKPGGFSKKMLPNAHGLTNGSHLWRWVFVESPESHAGHETPMPESSVVTPHQPTTGLQASGITLDQDGVVSRMFSKPGAS